MTEPSVAEPRRVSRGDVVWLRSAKPDQTNKLGLALFVEEGEAFFLMCDSDIRLAGHLDVVLLPRHAGIPFALAILTHVGAWVDFLRIQSAPVGRLSEDECFEVEGARAGQVPRALRTGRLLLDPVLEPRWPVIEKKARAFLEALEPAIDDSGWIRTREQFEAKFSKLELLFSQRNDSESSRDVLKTEAMDLYEALEVNPHWGADPIIWQLFDLVDNYLRAHSLAFA